MAAHYDSAVLPTRPRKPRDKAKVEACVRHRRALAARPSASPDFYSLAEVNAAIADC
jgi:transposase